MTDSVSLLIDFDTSKVIKRFTRIKAGEIYSTIDEQGKLVFIIVRRVSKQGTSIDFELLQTRTEGSRVICRVCAKKFTMRYNIKTPIFGISPTTTCPHCGCEYSETAFLITPAQFKEANENFTTTDEVKEVDKALNTLNSVLGDHFEGDITDYQVLESLIGEHKASKLNELIAELNKGANNE